MKINPITLIHSDKQETTLFPYLSSASSIRGTFLLIHSVSEHCGRYREFSLYLNQQGYDVYLYNLRGHGPDKKLEELGILPERNGHKKLIFDAVDILSYLSENNRGSKLLLFGQGFGALIARGATQVCDLVDALILCGPAFPTASAAFRASLRASIIGLLRGKNHISLYLARQLTETKRFRKLAERTHFDWLTRNQEVVGAYISDPYCGFPCSAGFYSNMFRLNKLISQPLMLREARKDLPILFIAGAEDPVSHSGNDVIRLFSLYQKLHYTNVDCILYPACRHELLNEPERQEIMDDIIAFLNRH